MLNKRPIVAVTDTDGKLMVLGGNMRLRACMDLKMKEVPVILADEWTEDQRREFIIKDNVGFGEWDLDQLANEWDGQQLQDWGLDIPVDFGAELNEGLTDPDEVPEVPETPITVLGDVWVLGKHRIVCGDSTKADTVAMLMKGAKAQLIHADPPYGMGKEKEGVANDNIYGSKLDAFQMEWWKAARKHVDDNASAYIWGNAPELWRLWYVGGLAKSERMTMRNEIAWSKPGGFGVGTESQRCYFPNERCLFFMLGEQGFNINADNYWEGWEPIRSYLETEMLKCGWKAKDLNRITGTNMAGHWVTRSQFVFITEEHYKAIQKAARDHDAFKRDHDALKRDHDALKREFYATRSYFDNAHDSMTDVWDFGRVTGAERKDHATPKPVAMLERCVVSSCPDGGIVLDPFCGTGPSIIAAEKKGRACYAIELLPQWVDVAVKRWEAFTGQQAVHEPSGKTFDELALTVAKQP
jgi:DNA modification methylase